MSDARASILGTIQKNLNRGPLADAARTVLEARLHKPSANLIPARAQVSHAEQIELFIDMAKVASASVQEVKGLENVPAAVAEFILRSNLPSDVVMAPDAALAALPWQAQERLRIERRPARDGDRVSVTPAFAGIAETGTLLLLSGPDSPTSLNFLPDTHIVVLPAAAIVGPYEDAWKRLRAHTDKLPRTLNLITGPSRSADIEQTLQLGAHGPVDLHIIVVHE